MTRIATWIRDVDEPWFARALAFAPEARLLNARVAPVDLTRVDALLLTGGSDIGLDYLPQRVETPELIRNPDPRRDAWEIPAVRSFFGRGRPLLAICRGHQVLNVALGGTLLLDIPGHNLPEQRDHDVQELRFAAGVPEARKFPRVNSSHHQAIERPADGIEIEAWSSADGIVEQVRHIDHPWCVGVQYHPERSRAYESLFRSFVWCECRS